MKTRLLIIILVGIIALLITLIILQNLVESKELVCLLLYKDINELFRTNEMQLGDQEIIQKHKDLTLEYVAKDCPDFHDLETIYNNYKQNYPIEDENE